MTKKREEMASSGTRAHADLMQRVDRIAGLLTELPDSAPTLYAEFLAFRQSTQEHFNDEESRQGLFANIVAAAPERSRAIDDLKEQHERLRRTLEDLYCEIAGMQSGGRLDTAGFRSRCEAFIEELRAHETEETGLLQRTFYRDMAAGD